MSVLYYFLVFTAPVQKLLRSLEFADHNTFCVSGLMSSGRLLIHKPCVGQVATPLNRR
ncbi:hypothetical protein SAMN04488109_2027 [Chryseolinea serpens]|uniref:Uncharacterized protein n=1 Tax=Chryseolinea serpens TaxID=947013 RepID=A0A1M5MZL7_9BACT|nr:hypothetical protein SAMN04488109_2027 [Chryseolinea serpens]